ncbi:Lectin-related protein [Spatholobus suberectus]|nr:Lectin-related protein [Spatholobus suberectus]
MAPTNWRPRYMYAINIVFTYLFLLQVKAEEELLLPTFSFTMNRFVPNQQDLIFQGDAQVSPTGVLELTQKVNGEPVSDSIGRVLYSAPFHIWDRRTNRSTSFLTEFTFVVKSPTNLTADGMAFFIAPPDSQIPPGSGGGLLGLFSDASEDNCRSTVAVEFDTYFNEEWDPPGLHHIGINVNSIHSQRTEPWRMNNGEIVHAVVIYLAENLNILYYLLLDPNDPQQTTHANVRLIDLKRVVPEWVRFGFSATVGRVPDHLESHDLLSWSFHALKLPDMKKNDEVYHKK